MLSLGAVGAQLALVAQQRELVSVPAEKVWYEPARPLAATRVERDPGVLDIGDVEIPGAGPVEIRVRPQDAATWKPINLRAVTLTPRQR